MQDKAYKVIKKCKEIAEKDFTKFSALFVAVMTVGLWVKKERQAGRSWRACWQAA